MGQLPKSKIEQLKKEKREAKAAKKRKVATRDKWYLLHFAYLDAGISRADYISKLEAEIRRFDGFKNFKYVRMTKASIRCYRRLAMWIWQKQERKNSGDSLSIHSTINHISRVPLSIYWLKN